MMNTARLAALLMLALIPLGLQAAVPSLGTLIDKAGRQRMLTQRIVRCYAQVGQFIKEDKAGEDIKRSVALFQAQLDELKAHAPNPEVEQALREVERRWGPFKAIATAPVSRERAPQLQENGDALMQASHEVVLRLEGQARTDAGRLVNLAGRQRMLSQRLAGLYLLQSWGFTQTQYRQAYEQALGDFEAAHRELTAADINTPAIHEMLVDVQRQWEMLKRGARLDQGEFIPLLVAMSAEKLLIDLNELTALYAALPH